MYHLEKNMSDEEGVNAPFTLFYSIPLITSKLNSQKRRATKVGFNNIYNII